MEPLGNQARSLLEKDSMKAVAEAAEATVTSPVHFTSSECVGGTDGAPTLTTEEGKSGKATPVAQKVTWLISWLFSFWVCQLSCWHPGTRYLSDKGSCGSRSPQTKKILCSELLYNYSSTPNFTRELHLSGEALVKTSEELQ